MSLKSFLFYTSLGMNGNTAAFSENGLQLSQSQEAVTSTTVYNASGNDGLQDVISARITLA